MRTYCVHVISRRRLRAFADTHPDCGKSLDAWYRLAKGARWSKLLDLQQGFPAAETAGKFTVFNIRGNHYRLITLIYYPGQTILVRMLLAHSDYHNDTWKDE